ncbi:unnamed protein product, partial [Oppiella nova]
MRTLFAILNAIITNTAYNDRIKWVNLGLNKYKTEFPDSLVSLFTFTSGANVAETDIVPHNRWTQTYLLPYLQRPTETIESVDFENVLHYGIEMFTDIKSNGGTFVVVIGGPGIKTSNNVDKVDKLAVQLRDKGIKLNIIVFPFDAHVNRVFASPLFQTAASVTSGRVVYVREDSLAARTAHQFMKAFGDLTNDYQIIDQKYIDPSGGTTIDFKFNVDNSLMNGDSPKTKTLRVYFMRTNTALDKPISGVQLRQLSRSFTPKPFKDTQGYIQGFIVTIDKSDDISGEFQLTATRADTSESVIAVA